MHLKIIWPREINLIHDKYSYYITQFFFSSIFILSFVLKNKAKMQIKKELFVMQNTVHQRVTVIMYLIIIFMFVWMLALSFGVAVMLHDGGDTFCSI